MRPTRVRIAPALGAILALSSCLLREPTGPHGPANQTILVIRADVSGTLVATVVVQLTAPDITTPLLFNIPVADGIASGTITVPAGSNRVITLRAYDAGGVQTHGGSVTVSIQPGTNPTISVMLTPLTGDLPIMVTLGSFQVTVQPATVTLAPGDNVGVRAIIVDPIGDTVTGQVAWATLAPGVATVTSTGPQTGRVTGVGGGQTTVVATYGGVAGAATIAVALPTLVQHVTTPNTRNTGGSFSTSLKIPLPNATLSGNAFVVVVGAARVAASQSVTCTDNVSNTYTERQANGGTVGFHGMWLFTASHTTAGATSVTCTFSVGTNFISGAFSEWQNVATDPFDVGNTSENTTFTTNWAGGSATTGTSGDLIYQCAQNNTSIPYHGTSFAAQSGFTLGSADLSDGLVCQWQVQARAGTVNPTFTANPSAGYISVWAALKPAYQGTAPTVTPRIVHLQHSNPSTTATSGTLQFPSSGNLLHVSFISGQVPPNGLAIALSSSPANTWTQVTGSPCMFADVVVQEWYAANASTSNALTFTFTLGSAPEVAGQDFIFYDITGAASSPVDTQNCMGGTQTVPGNLTAVSVTPGAAGELSIFVGDHNISTLTGTVADGNGHLPLFNMPTWGGEDLCTDHGANNDFTLDAAAADFNNTDATQQTVIYTETTCATAEWAHMVVVYKAAATP